MARLAPLTLLLSAAALPVAAQSPVPAPGAYEEWATPSDFQELAPPAPPAAPPPSASPTPGEPSAEGWATPTDFQELAPPAPPPAPAPPPPRAQAAAEQVRAARAEALAAEQAARIARERAEAALQALQIAERDARAARQAVEVTEDRIRAEQQLRAAEEQARAAEEQARAAEQARRAEQFRQAEQARIQAQMIREQQLRQAEQARVQAQVLREQQLRQAEHARLTEQARREAELEVQRARHQQERAEAEARREAEEAAREAELEAEAQTAASAEAEAGYAGAEVTYAPQSYGHSEVSSSYSELAENPFLSLTADGAVVDRDRDVGVYNLGLRFEGDRGGLLATMGGLSTGSGEWRYFTIEPTFAIVATENFRWRVRAGWSSAFTRNVSMSGFSGGGSMVIHIGGPVDLELDGHLTLVPFFRLDTTAAWALNFGGLSLRAGWRATYLNDLGHANGYQRLHSGYFGPYLGLGLHM